MKKLSAIIIALLVCICANAQSKGGKGTILNSCA